MYKRKDWHLYQKGADDSSSDESSGTPSEEESSEESSDDEEESSPAPGNQESLDATDLVDNSQIGRRLEDLSEDDYETDEEAEERKQELDALKKRWLEGAEAGKAPEAEEEEEVKGRALKCRLCKGVLMLNAASLQQHLASKKHKKRMLDWPEHFPDPVGFGEDIKHGESEAETHAERQTRMKEEAAAVQAKSEKKKRKPRERKGKRTSKKPGKRQRMALKQGAAT